MPDPSLLKPSDEDARLAALRRYGILDTAGEAGYDDIVTVAACICGVPIALISLVDESRQWFKARVGLDVDETPREVAFCAHAIAAGGFLEVSDASADPRFADNPLVTGHPMIRSYAGAPLITPDGFALGTLCVIDRVPRTLEPQQRAALEALARHVVRLFEHRRATEALLDVTREFEDFSERVAHDLKNPLSAIRGYTDLLQRKYDSLEPAMRQEIVERLGELALRTTAMVDQVLDQARAGAHAARRTSRPRELVTELLADAALADAETAVEGSWPELLVSPVDLRCIVTNLVANAHHYGRSADGVLRLRVSAAQLGSVVHLTFADQGQGVDPRVRSTLFEPFVNGPSSRLANEVSTGLGLALVRRAAELAGGSVTLADTATGAAIVVTLPVVETANA